MPRACIGGGDGGGKPGFFPDAETCSAGSCDAGICEGGAAVHTLHAVCIPVLALAMLLAAAVSLRGRRGSIILPDRNPRSNGASR